MNLEQAIAMQDKQEKMWQNIVNPIKDSLAEQDVRLREKLAKGETLDRLEASIAINRGIK